MTKSRRRSGLLAGLTLGVIVSIASLGGAALAGTGIGDVFSLGKTNTVNASTVLSGATNGAQLNVRNASTAPQATGIVIKTAPGRSPLVVGSATKVKNLDADLLEGVDASSLQQRIVGSCGEGSSLLSVGSDGSVGCGHSGVFSLQQVPLANQHVDQHFGASPLEVETACHFNGGTTISFLNTSASAGQLDWIIDGTGSTISGSAISSGFATFFSLDNRRIEAQLVWSQPGLVATYNVHAIDGGTLCETTGTVQVAKQ
jgi:hypothetical protein